MKRHSRTTANTVEYSMSLVVDRCGGARMTRGSASLSAGERELRLNISVPKAIFATPSLTASIKVEEGGFQTKIEEVRAVASEALTAAFPLVLKIEAPES